MKESEARHAVGRVFALRFPRSWDDLDLARFPIANYIVFKDVLGPSLETSRQTLNGARLLLEDRGIDPIFMIDEEGGRVTQISDFCNSAPSPRAVSTSITPQEAGKLYAEMSAQLARIGIDINLFPCLDVNTESMNPIIGTRSFGKTAEVVSRYTKVVIDESRLWVGCVGKHFPGHGMTLADSHNRRPVVHDDLKRLESIHLRPFREAIDAGVDGIMVAHCLYTSLQTDDLPASLSKQVVRSILRGEMRYAGLVFTDSLDMKAVTEHVDPRRIGLLGLEAGCDILLFTEYSARFETVFETIVESMLMGRLKPERLTQSETRRHKLIQRIRWLRASQSPQGEDIFGMLAAEVALRSRRIDDPKGLLPLPPQGVTVVAEPPTVLEHLRDYVDELGEASDPAALRDRTLLIWLGEPLRLERSLDDLRALISAAKASVLVTTYEALVEELTDCDATIISEDSSPGASRRIIADLFEA
jgi:beta-glucosidase-like glycosyl hydrolase